MNVFEGLGSNVCFNGFEFIDQVVEALDDHLFEGKEGFRVIDSVVMFFGCQQVVHARIGHGATDAIEGSSTEGCRVGSIVGLEGCEAEIVFHW